jgi:hypothetical protein
MAEKSVSDLKAELQAGLDELAALKAQYASAPAPSGGIDAATLESILTRTSKAASAGSELLASKLKPENVDHLNLSPFDHPEGGLKVPKPLLAREMWFGGFHLREHELTFAEVAALNLLSSTLMRSQRRVTHNGQWVATVSDDDARLQISVPMKTMDQRSDLPSFLLIIQELTSGERAIDAASMAEEMALLRNKVARLEAVTAG